MVDKKHILKVINHIVLIAWLALLVSREGYAQNQVVLIKVYNQKLEPFRNEELSFNGSPFITVDKNGQLYKEFDAQDLPLKSVHLKNSLFEVATWSYSKGKIEIVVRPRTSQNIHLSVYDEERQPVRSQSVSYNNKPEGSTSSNGTLEFDIPIHSIVKAEQFALEGFDIVSLESQADGNYNLSVRRTPPKSADKTESNIGSIQPIARLQNRELGDLDSIQSFSELYALFKQLELNKIDEGVHEKINEKFYELLNRRRNQPSGPADYTQMITDTSRINDDIVNLLKQARSEHEYLNEQRSDFDRSVQTIQHKLAQGIQGLNESERNNLMQDLAALENILMQNERFFTENHEYFLNLLSLMKDNFFDISDLENKLSASEMKRLAQEKKFRERIMLISSLVLLFGVLVLLLMRSDRRLRKVNQRITEMNENLEYIVMQRTKMLTLANQELDTFLYRASHDLRSPVCSIQGLCNIAAQVANPESQDLLQKVSGTVTIMDKLLKKLSVISEINQPSGYGEIHVKDSIVNTVKTFENTIAENKVDIRIQCDDQLIFHSYPNLFEVVLSNLMENALFYSLIKNTDNAKIDIEARTHEDNVQIIVTDNGIGIDHKIKSHLFEMFFKGNENSKGNGLGLYIVLKSIQALQGEVEVESQPDQYSKFIITLPIRLEIKTLTLGEKLRPDVTPVHPSLRSLTHTALQNPIGLQE